MFTRLCIFNTGFILGNVENNRLGTKILKNVSCVEEKITEKLDALCNQPF